MSVINFLPVLITAVGLYFLIKLRFFFLVHPTKCIKAYTGELSDRGSFKALTLALAGTLGVGNIIGVAHGISVGGAGSVFWILVSSIFASILKYAECTLVADGYTSMAGLIRKTFFKAGRVLSVIYSVLWLFLSLTMGTALQSNALVGSAKDIFSLNPTLLSLIFTLLVALLIFGGVKKIENATAYIIPIATIVYIFICLSVILVNIKSLGTVIGAIFGDAFNFKSAYGGVSSFLMINAMREGYARGLLSNEAGAGTSATAQARGGKHPAFVGLSGIAEVFFDTTLLCTLTGVATLCSVKNPEGTGVSIILSVFRVVLHGFSPYVLFLLMLAFVYSTVICWYYYGTTAFTYLFGKKYTPVYTSLFLLSVFLGARISEGVLITVSDYLLFLMTLITLSALIKSSGRLVCLTEQYGLIKKLKKPDV